MLKDHYSRLFLQNGASEQEVKIAYRKLVKKFHPDKNLENNEYIGEFRLIQESYNELIKHFNNEKHSEAIRKEKQENEFRRSKKKKDNTKYAQVADTEIIVSGSKFADVAEDEIKSSDSLYYAVLYFLIACFAACSVYGIIDQFK